MCKVKPCLQNISRNTGQKTYGHCPRNKHPHSHKFGHSTAIVGPPTAEPRSPIDPLGGGGSRRRRRLWEWRHFQHSPMRQLSDARSGDPRIMATCVAACDSARITLGVSRHKNIPLECNVTIWNFYDPEFFMYEMSRRMGTSRCRPRKAADKWSLVMETRGM